MAAPAPDITTLLQAWRGGDPGDDLDRIPAAGTERAQEICALDDALSDLAAGEPRRAQVIELRFFGGLSVEETAEVLTDPLLPRERPSR